MREKREIIELRFHAFVASPLFRLLAALEDFCAPTGYFYTSLSLTRPCGTIMPRSSHYNHSYIVNIVIIIAIRPIEMQNFENLTIDANLKSTSIVA